MQCCVGTIVDVGVSTAVELAKAPFKVVGAAIDLAVPDDDDD